MGNQITDSYGRPYKDIELDVGSGWGPLVRNLIDDLFEAGWDGSIHQIKEKFGGLRFYVGDCSQECHELITKAEDESLRTCETCGEPGTQSDGGWIKTLCETHMKIDRMKQFVEEERWRGREPKEVKVQLHERLGKL